MTNLQPNGTRIATIDALRGFCLLGIILVHYTTWHTGGPLPDYYYNQQNDPGSIAAFIFSTVFLQGKFFALFSLLFGLSFYLQIESGLRSGTTFIPRYLRRLCILLLIALLHHSLWMGDILIIYVPLAFVLLAMRGISNRTAITLAILFILNVPGRIWDVVNFFWVHAELNDGMGAFAQQHADAVTTGSLWDIVVVNWQIYVAKMKMQLYSGRLLQTMGYFLLGMYIGRKKWLHDVVSHRPTLKRWNKRAGWTVLAGVLLVLALVGSNEMLKLGWQESPVMGFIFNIIVDVANAAMVVWYVSGIGLLIQKPWWSKRILTLVPAGKMALTVYIMQTLVGYLIFYGVGFGLLGKITPGICFTIAMVVFMLQAWFAKAWFQQFRYGPVEWLWRCGTQGQWLPLRR